MDYQYFKYHGLGNDYIVIDPQKTDIRLSLESIKLYVIETLEWDLMEFYMAQ